MGSRGCSCWLLSLALLCSLAAAKEQYHEFVIRETTVKRLCKSQSIMTVNGQFPGPTLEIKEGDSLIINLINRGSYPFHVQPTRELAPILLGEWWDMNPVDVVRAATRTGAAPNISDALTVNAQPGDLYSCSSHDTALF
uniref:Plastocyanin-like domain-containing protein n=1 Tax=Oryza barthii TaxID=65489 RepID=A0A0D3HH98_9ORYZ